MTITRYLKKCTHHVSTELQMLTISQNLHIWKASLPPPTHVCTHSLACVVSVTVSPSDCLYQNQQESLRFSWPPKIWLQSLYSCQYFDDKKTRKLTRKHGFLDSYGGGKQTVSAFAALLRETCKLSTVSIKMSSRLAIADIFHSVNWKNKQQALLLDWISAINISF